MKISTKEILAAIKKPINEMSAEGDLKIFLDIFESVENIGVGSSSDGRTVLLLPGQSNVTSFETNFASFNHWVSVTRAEDNKVLDDVALLTLNIEKTDQATIDAATAIFLGIIDLQIKFGKCGEAIWQMKSLFESELKYKPTDEAVTGLIGELIFILNSKDKVKTIKCWHSAVDDTYDFSSESIKLDVKATRSGIRHHYFSSTQIPASTGKQVLIASVLVDSVEMGTTLNQIMNKVNENLSSDLVDKVISCVLKQIGTHPGMVLNPQIDIDNTLKSINIYDSHDIPCPEYEEQVLSVKWLATLDKTKTSKIHSSGIPF
jgi:hypothetical protein